MRPARTALTALVLLTISTTCIAEDARFVIPFGAEPGAPLTHAYDYGVPPVKEGLYTMRVPTVDDAIKPIFSDLEITIEAPNKTVKRSHAERAYGDLGECNKAASIIGEKLHAVLPNSYTGNDLWQQQSADGRVVGGARCKVERYLPFPILEFDLSVAP